MKNVYLVRHGEAEDDINKTYGGWADDPLTQKGEKLAEDLAKELTNLGIKKIYSSPLKRAKVTAEIIGKHLQIPIQTVEDLKERNRYGDLTGMKMEEAKERFPLMVAKVQDYQKTIKGAETYEHFKERVLESLKKIIKASDEDILIVGHGGTFRIVMWEVLNRHDFTNADLHAILYIQKAGEKLTLQNSRGLKFRK